MSSVKCKVLAACVAALAVSLATPVAPCAAARERGEGAGQEHFLLLLTRAIGHVESGNRDDAPDGDGGNAIGRYQIHRAYWQDAVEFDRQQGGKFGIVTPADGTPCAYESCRRSDYAHRVVRAYMFRYAGAAIRARNAMACARIHNGGPDGAHKACTRTYGKRVVQRMRDYGWRGPAGKKSRNNGS